MNRYKCPDCGGYQYTANTHAAGSPCIYCKTGKVILDSEGAEKNKIREAPEALKKEEAQYET